MGDLQLPNKKQKSQTMGDNYNYLLKIKISNNGRK